jgi:hypothetical protein
VDIIDTVIRYPSSGVHRCQFLERFDHSSESRVSRSGPSSEIKRACLPVGMVCNYFHNDNNNNMRCDVVGGTALVPESVSFKIDCALETDLSVSPASSKLTVLLQKAP